jgi:thiol-disulfide isomerase/thioredoxin
VSRRLALVSLAALMVIAGAAVWFASTTDPSDIVGASDPDNLPVLADSVPGPDRAEGWLNSDPLGRADLDDKVVVYDFWTYSCVNCIRTLPYLKSWWERYEADGLVIVGVHSPEFEFERDEENVAEAVSDLGVTWPVALDGDHAIWNAFGNRYWPAKYVTDRLGRLRYLHFGEGSYRDTEDVLRALLGVSDDAPRATGGSEEDDAVVPAVRQTPETYLGADRGTTASPEGLDLGERTFTVPEVLHADSFALDGRWLVQAQYVEALERGAAIVLRYRGSEVNLVLSAADQELAVPVRIELDGEEIERLEVREPRLYPLVVDGPEGDHLLRIVVERPGVQAFAFTFGA